MRKTWASARWAKAAALVLAACCAQPAAAVNKCTGKEGAVVYQDAPCANAAAASANVKTWSNSPGSFGAVRQVQPDTKLVGPVQAAPLMNAYRRWIDGERLALATGRIALAGPVAALQALQREVEQMPVPECLADSKQALVGLSSASVNTLLQFMHKDELTGMVYQFLDRPKLIQAFEQSVSHARCG